MLVAGLLVGCNRKKNASVEAKKKAVEVGLIFDEGGLGDKSFNDIAYEGLKRAEKELGVSVTYFEPNAQAQHEAALRRMSQKGVPLIIGGGFLFSVPMTRMAREFPKLKYVCIDYNVPREGTVPPNLLGIKFREHEGTYLVGAIAALVSRTGKIGFVGGKSGDLIERFEAGYRAGAKAVRPKVKVLVLYVGSWSNSGKGKELAMSQYADGADIIMHAAGTSGLGVFQAAKQTGKLAIGVDKDQAANAPGRIVTSMLKRVDQAVFRAISDYKSGKFKGGVLTLGLAEKAIGYVYDDKNKQWITPEIHQKIESLRKQIIAGKIQVPTQ